MSGIVIDFALCRTFRRGQKDGREARLDASWRAILAQGQEWRLQRPAATLRAADGADASRADVTLVAAVDAVVEEFLEHVAPGGLLFEASEIRAVKQAF